jgi:hypothetical protein
MTLKQAFLALPVAALCALGCSGSPTSSNGFQLSITATVSNTAMQATILDTQLLIDGATTEDVTVLAALASVPLSVTGSAGSGGHTLAVLIAKQTTTPNSYTVTTPIVQVFDSNGNFVRNIQLTTQTASLATGQSISYTFSL